MWTARNRTVSRRLPCALLALAAVVVWPAAADAQSRREMQMMADIRMLQEQNQQLQNAIAQLGEVLKAINGRIEEQNNTNRKAFADQKLMVDQFGSDLRVVRERIDETNVRLTSLSQEMEGLRLAIPQYPPPGAVTPGTDPSAVPGSVPENPTDPGAAAAAPAPVMQPGMSPQRMFSSAWGDYSLGQWALCVSGFDMYLKSYPRTDNASDAQFYIGECQFSDGKFTEAVEAYNRTITNYPNGERVPDAYYKRGLALERLGQVDRARESYEEVVKNYPNSQQATLSKQRLDALNRAKP